MRSRAALITEWNNQEYALLRYAQIQLLKYKDNHFIFIISCFSFFNLKIVSVTRGAGSKCYFTWGVKKRNHTCQLWTDTFHALIFFVKHFEIQYVNTLSQFCPQKRAVLSYFLLVLGATLMKYFKCAFKTGKTKFIVW